MKAESIVEDLAGFRLNEGAQRSLFGDAFGDARLEARAAQVAVLDSFTVAGVEVPRVTNEFWAPRQRQGHSLHELSYRACFKAELPRFFIERLTRPGDTVLDPFMGRGTTCLEAALLGRVPYGNDVNPLSRVLLEPRLDPPTSAEVAARLADYAAEGIFDGAATQLGCQRPLGGEVDDSELEVFYHPDTLRGLQALRRRFAQAPLDRVDAWLRMVATNRLSGHSPGFFSVRTMPPNQAVSVESQRKLNAKHGLVPPKRDVSALLVRKSRSLLRGLDAATRQRLASQRATARLSTDDARRMQAFADSSVQLVVTSPPFVDVVDYAGDNWLRCWFNGIDAASTSQSITTPRKADAWQDFVAAVMLELKRVLLPGGWIVFEVGEVRKGTLKLEDLVVPAARAAGLEVVALAVHKQDFTKTANCWGVANNTKGTNTQRLVILRKAVRKAVRNASNEEAGA